MASPISLPQILVGCNLALGYSRNIWLGVCRYAREHDCFLPLHQGDNELSTNISKIERLAGVIAMFHNADQVARARRHGIPLVNVSGLMPDDPALPRVGLDDFAIGRLAGEHLLSRGVRHMAFQGANNHAYADLRLAGFVHALRSARQTADPLLLKWPVSQQVLQSLPIPLGVFAVTDHFALRLSHLCMRAGIRVPEQVAIIGVDNDDVVCEAAYRPISSVAVYSERIGYEAGRIMHDLLQGKPAPAQPVLFQPGQVVARASTDLGAVGDDLVGLAVKYIHDNFHEPINMKDLLDAVPSSRTALTQRFQKVLGRTPTDELHRVRIERAKEMLSDTRMSMLSVALSSGFKTASRLSAAFRAATGETPSAYRQRFFTPRATD